MGIWIVLGLVVVAVIAAISVYNGLIAKKNQVENAEASIDVMLKKRFDLIPNMVESVKAYMAHESSLLQELTALRTQVQQDGLSGEKKISLDKQLNTAMSRFNIAVENYPDLKASENFVMLQRTINEAEEQISAARRAYNASVTDLNNAIEMFPSSLFASRMNLKQRELFDIPEQERQNINVGQLFHK
ncbi:LemA family protein [Photobacterium sp. 1_MG-2023]|uniref:LemA family protein n=1 Tax=Photobacterium sp. 1_MG-2023 TaxID=3062646 RepID=UPI0026E2733A|nr:LemA family protein [Photobacterium sp. 1_MG-2023]MDO6706623.1 LemA family protein [Photobacterium sp. 1_MG-2023]